LAKIIIQTTFGDTTDLYSFRRKSSVRWGAIKWVKLNLFIRKTNQKVTFHSKYIESIFFPQWMLRSELLFSCFNLFRRFRLFQFFQGRNSTFQRFVEVIHLEKQGKLIHQVSTRVVKVTIPIFKFSNKTNSGNSILSSARKGWREEMIANMQGITTKVWQMYYLQIALNNILWADIIWIKDWNRKFPKTWQQYIFRPRMNN